MSGPVLWLNQGDWYRALWAYVTAAAAVTSSRSSRDRGLGDRTRGKDMHAELRQAYDREMQAAAESYDGGNLENAFSHLERAHILGQSYTCPHARAHWWMLKVGWE